MNNQIELLTDVLAFGVGAGLSSLSGGTFSDMVKLGATAIGVGVVVKDIINQDFKCLGVDGVLAATGTYLPWAKGTGALKSAMSTVGAVRGAGHIISGLSKADPQPQQTPRLA